MKIEDVILGVRFAKYASDELKGELPCPVAGMRKIENKGTDTQAFLFQTATRLYIVFPCTASARDVLTDLDVKMTDWVLAGPKPGSVIKARVARGFLAAWTSINTELIQAIWEMWDDRDVMICGYSLGGALAIPCGLTMLYSTADVQMVTCGGPRFGDAAFRDVFQAWIPAGRFVRLVNRGDPYPQVPNQEPSLFAGRLYQHVVPETTVAHGKATPPRPRAWWERAWHYSVRWVTARLGNKIDPRKAPLHSINLTLDWLEAQRKAGQTELA